MSWIWVGLTAARGGAGALGFVPVTLVLGALGVLNDMPDIVLKLIKLVLTGLLNDEKLNYRSQLLPCSVLPAVDEDISIVEDS